MKLRSLEKMLTKDGEIVGNFEDMSIVVEERMFVEKRNNRVYVYFLT